MVEGSQCLTLPHLQPAFRTIGRLLPSWALWSGPSDMTFSSMHAKVGHCMMTSESRPGTLLRLSGKLPSASTPYHQYRVLLVNQRLCAIALVHESTSFNLSSVSTLYQLFARTSMRLEPTRIRSALAS